RARCRAVGQSARHRWHGAQHRDCAVDAADRAAAALRRDDGEAAQAHHPALVRPVSRRARRLPARAYRARTDPGEPTVAVAAAHRELQRAISLALFIPPPRSVGRVAHRERERAMRRVGALFIRTVLAETPPPASLSLGTLPTARLRSRGRDQPPSLTDA